MGTTEAGRPAPGEEREGPLIRKKAAAGRGGTEAAGRQSAALRELLARLGQAARRQARRQGSRKTRLA